MSYGLTIRKRDDQPQVEVYDVLVAIRKLPGVSDSGGHAFIYKGRDPRFQFEIDVGGKETTDSISIRVPAGFTNHSVPLAILAGFELSKQLGWELFDEQAGRNLDEDTRSEVTEHLRSFGRSPRAILKQAAEHRQSWLDEFVACFSTMDDAWSLASALFAAVGAGVIVVIKNLPFETPWYFLGIWAVDWLLIRALLAVTQITLARRR